MNARYGLIGCGVTHLKTIKEFIDTYGTDGTKVAVILEDDFQIVDHGLIKEQIHTAINQSEDWDFIYLGGLRNAKEDKREEYLPGLDIAISVWNAHAYVIRNTQDIYDRMKTLFEDGYMADRATRKLIRNDKKRKERYLITHPYIIQQRRNYSDINNFVR
jgi:GR25 family glycosyltransferase involved in LPS biosynthesis